MTDYFDSLEPGSLSEVEPLKSLWTDGKRLKRPPYVDQEIARLMALSQSGRIAELREARPETIVYFIRRCPPTYRWFYEPLFVELDRRIAGTARTAVRGLDRFSATDIVLKVQQRVLDLIFTKQPSRRSDFLEIAFHRIVEARALDALRSHLRSPFGPRRIAPGVPDDDGVEIERPVELLLDEGPGPEELLLKLREDNERHQLLAIASKAVKSRRHLIAVILHYGYDWPITASDPKIACLTRQFGVDERQIRYWLDTAMRQMREALMIQEAK